MKVRLYAPCFNPEGKTEVALLRDIRTSRGDVVWEVEAIHGEPWTVWTHGGWTSTDRKSFFPEVLIIRSEQ